MALRRVSLVNAADYLHISPIGKNCSANLRIPYVHSYTGELMPSVASDAYEVLQFRESSFNVYASAGEYSKSTCTLHCIIVCTVHMYSYVEVRVHIRGVVLDCFGTLQSALQMFR